MPKHRPTDAEFEELKRKRDEAMKAVVASVCEKNGWNPAEVTFHASHVHGCYCACPDGPCQHIWDGPEFVDADGSFSSVTCSLCGQVAMFHDMRCAP